MTIHIAIGNAEIMTDDKGFNVVGIAPVLASAARPPLVLPAGIPDPTRFNRRNAPANTIRLSTSYWREFCLATNLGGYFYKDLGFVQLNGNELYRKLAAVDCQVIRAARITFERRCIGEQLDPGDICQQSHFSRLLWLEYEIFYAFNTHPHPSIFITST